MVLIYWSRQVIRVGRRVRGLAMALLLGLSCLCLCGCGQQERPISAYSILFDEEGRERTAPTGDVREMIRTASDKTAVVNALADFLAHSASVGGYARVVVTHALLRTIGDAELSQYCDKEAIAIVVNAALQLDPGYTPWGDPKRWPEYSFALEWIPLRTDDAYNMAVKPRWEVLADLETCELRLELFKGWELTYLRVTLDGVCVVERTRSERLGVAWVPVIIQDVLPRERWPGWHERIVEATVKAPNGVCVNVRQGMKFGFFPRDDFIHD